MHDPLTGYIRVKVICAFARDGRILAVDSFDPTKRQSFWVPVGGQVEMGETSEQALKREVREELSTEITDVRLLGVLENLFTFDGGAGHEIVFVYDARFVDESVYGTEPLRGLEGEAVFEAHWIDPRAPTNGWPLYPDGMLPLLGSTPAADA